MPLSIFGISVELQQSILISCTDASTVTKVSPERNIMKSMLKDVAAKQKKIKNSIVINVKKHLTIKDYWQDIKETTMLQKNSHVKLAMELFGRSIH